MKKFLLLAVLIPLFLSAQNVKTVLDQLVYVNEQWVNQKDVPASLKHSAAKPLSEQQLIQFHLQETEKLLRKRNIPSLSPAQKKQRLSNLNTLHQYWVKGVFPINDQHQNRQPYFIDKFNTYCAVGYLMQQSGGDVLARDIHNKQNFSYLFDINHPQLMRWAEKSGLTLDELALIQPAYPFDRPATVLEFHYNNTGTDAGEYIEIQQPIGMMTLGPVTQILFYNAQGTLYKTLDVSQMQSLAGGVLYYQFPASENFADEGNFVLNSNGNVSEKVIYGVDSVHIEDYSMQTTVRSYYIGENESTPAGTSLTFCGTSFGFGTTNLSLQNMVATPGTLNSCTFLPVQLGEFSFQVYKNEVHLSWQTLTEVNTKSFTIERSDDGTNFSKIGGIEAAGNSTSVKKYSFTDNHPNYINHYRIKQIDADGKLSYSKLLFVKMPKANPLDVMQTVGSDHLQINIHLPQNEIASVALYDISGKLLKKLKPQSGVQTIRLNSVAQGSYLVQLISANGQVYNKQIIR